LCITLSSKFDKPPVIIRSAGIFGIFLVVIWCKNIKKIRMEMVMVIGIGNGKLKAIPVFLKNMMSMNLPKMGSFSGKY
jgi:hypothetical protein